MRSQTSRSRKRQGYTLLEVIVTLAIAGLVLSGLYVALFTQLRLAQAGRDVIQRSTTARNLLTRIGSDIANHLGPMSPWLQKKFPAAGSSNGTPTSSQNTGQIGNATDSSGAQAADSKATDSASQTTDNMMPTTASGVFNVSVIGSSAYLRLSLTRFPRPGKEGEPISDLARIEYWVVEGKGLARREVTRVTAEDEDVEAPSLPEADKYVIGDNVESITFRYWDGSAWLDTWDGLQPGSDANATPLGPPAAIEITLRLRSRAGGEQSEARDYQHVVAIRTANIAQPATAP